MVTDEELLALKAVAHGCNINRKLVGATCMLNCTDPEKSQTISYSDAIVTVYELIERLEKSKRKDGHSA